MVAELKSIYHDSYTNYHKLKPEVQDRLIKTQLPLIVAANWQRHGFSMIERTYTALSKGMHRIDPRFSKLVTALRSATSTPADTDYDKSKTSYNDVLSLMHSYSSR